MQEPPLAPFYAGSRVEGAAAAALGSAVFVGSIMVGDEGRGTLAAAFVTSIAIVLRICWPLIRKLWFWVTMCVITSAHVFFLFYTRWSSPAKWTGLTLIPFMVADILIMLSIVYLLFRSIYGQPPHLVQSASDRSN